MKIVYKILKKMAEHDMKTYEGNIKSMREKTVGKFLKIVFVLDTGVFSLNDEKLLRGLEKMCEVRKDNVKWLEARIST